MTPDDKKLLNFPGLAMIHIVWEGPILITDTFGLTGDQDFGLYVLYGTHSVLGPDALLYVGQSNAKPFGGRLKDHYDEWACREPSDVNVYLGRVGGWKPATDDDWATMIDRAEALTIYFTSPPYNSHHIRELKVQEPMLVLNHNRRHRLPMCITNIPEWIDLDDVKLHGGTGHHPQPSPEAKEHEENDV